MANENYLLREPVRDFANEMERQLRKHDFKGVEGWKDLGVAYLDCKVMEKVGEYFKIEAQEFINNFKESYKKRRQLIHIANYCMMIYKMTEDEFVLDVDDDQEHY